MWEEGVGNALGNGGSDCAVWRDWYRSLGGWKIQHKVCKDVRETRKKKERKGEITLTLICLRERRQHFLLMGKPVISTREAPSTDLLKSVNH